MARNFAIRGETRLKNARLVAAREVVNMTVKEFAAMHGINYPTYSGYETMRLYPSPRHRELLSKYCGCTEDELFPPELKKFESGERPRGLVNTVIIEPSRLLGSVRREALLMPTSTTPEDEVNEKSKIEVIEEALSHLKEREAKILRLYFGLDGHEPLTLEEIAGLLGLTRERTRQIKEKALSRLRDPSLY